MIEPEEASKLLDQQAEKNHRRLVGRVLLEIKKPLNPEGRKALFALKRALHG